MTGGQFVGAERKTEGVSDSLSLVVVTGLLDFIGEGLGSENYSNTNKFLTENVVKKIDITVLVCDPRPRISEIRVISVAKA